MSQVNFRLNSDENEILKELAAETGISVAEYSKRLLKENISSKRINIAFKRLAQGKIHKKRAWILSGLTYNEFMIEWAKRGAEDIIPDEIEEKGVEFALNLDTHKYRKPKK